MSALVPALCLIPCDFPAASQIYKPLPVSSAWELGGLKQWKSQVLWPFPGTGQETKLLKASGVGGKALTDVLHFLSSKTEGWMTAMRWL